MGRCFALLPERIPKASRRSANGNEVVSLLFWNIFYTDCHRSAERFVLLWIFVIRILC